MRHTCPRARKPHSCDFLRLSKTGREGSQLCRRGDKALLRQDAEIIIDAIGRALESSAHLAHSLTEYTRRKTQVVGQELVGVLRLDAMNRKHLGREMLEVLRHDHVAVASDSRREHMPIPNIW